MTCTRYLLPFAATSFTVQVPRFCSIVSLVFNLVYNGILLVLVSPMAEQVRAHALTLRRPPAVRLLSWQRTSEHSMFIRQPVLMLCEGQRFPARVHVSPYPLPSSTAYIAPALVMPPAEAPHPTGDPAQDWSSCIREGRINRAVVQAQDHATKVSHSAEARRNGSENLLPACLACSRVARQLVL